MLDPALEAEGLGPSAFSEALDGDWAARRAESGAADSAARRAGGRRRRHHRRGAVRQLLDLPRRGSSWSTPTRTASPAWRATSAAGAPPRAGPSASTRSISPPGRAWPSPRRGPFDRVLNFAAMKHVRSEKNPFTLLHMIDVNVVRSGASPASAPGPGAAPLRGLHRQGRRPRELHGRDQAAAGGGRLRGGARPGAPIATAARFANVAYSSGSLLESYFQRFDAGQALAAPKDTRRYFIAARDAARICLLAELACGTGRMAIPKFDPASGAVELAETAAAFLRTRGTGGVRGERPPRPGCWQAAAPWPVLLTPRDTAGEKEVEVFRGRGESTEDAEADRAGGPAPRAGRPRRRWRRPWTSWRPGSAASGRRPVWMRWPTPSARWSRSTISPPKRRWMIGSGCGPQHPCHPGSGAAAIRDLLCTSGDK